MNIPGLTDLLSIQSLFGASTPAQGLLHSNSFVPMGALLGVWLVGGRLLRMATGLVPIAVMVLFMLGSDPGVKQILGAHTEILDTGASLPGSFNRQGWLLPLCVLAGIFMLGRRRLSFIHIALAIGAVSYLLATKDFRIHSIVQSPSSQLGMIGIGAGLGLLILHRLFRSGRVRYVAPMPLGTQITSLKPVVVGAVVGCAAIFGVILMAQPLLVERTFPAWRSTFGIWMLCVSLYSLHQSLPGRFKQFMLPVFWCAVSLVIGAQLTQSQFQTSSLNAQNVEQF